MNWIRIISADTVTTETANLFFLYLSMPLFIQCYFLLYIFI